MPMGYEFDTNFWIYFEYDNMEKNEIVDINTFKKLDLWKSLFLFQETVEKNLLLIVCV